MRQIVSARIRLGSLLEAMWRRLADLWAIVTLIATGRIAPSCATCDDAASLLRTRSSPPSSALLSRSRACKLRVPICSPSGGEVVVVRVGTVAS